MPKVITGTWQNPDASPVANGLLVLEISQDTTAVNTAQIAPRRVVIQLDTNGSIPASTTLYANDELSPANTVYNATVYTANFGGRVWGPEKLSIAGTSPIALLSAIASPAGVVFSAPVYTNPTAPQTITGFGLTLTSSAPLTIQGTLFLSPGPLTIASAATVSRTATFPDNTGTIAELNLAQTWTANQTFSAVVSSTANPAASGTLRLASTDTINWRNAANTADVTIGKNSLDQFNLTAVTITQGLIPDTNANRDVGSTTLAWRNVFLTGTVQSATATMGITNKQGTESGTDYSTTSSTISDVDTTNLAFTVTIPTGWKLSVICTAEFFSGTSGASMQCFLYDGVTVIYMQRLTAITGSTSTAAVALSAVIVGDGASHTIKWRFLSEDNVSTVSLVNRTTKRIPRMIFTLMPSN